LRYASEHNMKISQQAYRLIQDRKMMMTAMIITATEL